jgi:ribonuclease HII
MADLRLERVLWGSGFTVIGIDEAGRGPLAGPVVAGACILPQGARLPQVNDSKKLSEKRRDAAYERILDVAMAWGVGIVDHHRIDQVNIRNATFEAMDQATRCCLDRLGHLPQRPGLLIDGNALLPQWTGEQRWIIGGDRKSLSIAAASILAKVTRDRMMLEYDLQYPGYGFARHKGYAAREHLEALDALGPTPIHRMTFIDHRQLKFF